MNWTEEGEKDLRFLYTLLKGLKIIHSFEGSSSSDFFCAGEGPKVLFDSSSYFYFSSSVVSDSLTGGFSPT